MAKKSKNKKHSSDFVEDISDKLNESPKKVSSADACINIEGVNVPNEVADLFSTYYYAFMNKGFDSKQAFELTQQMLIFYLWR